MHIYKCLHEQMENVEQNESGILNREEREQRTELESRARTHLANERTFLAWLRTGIALISLGLAAAQFLEPSHTWSAPYKGHVNHHGGNGNLDGGRRN
jgi:uncharacterized membrane protein YidH (DUF202 family)